MAARKKKRAEDAPAAGEGAEAPAEPVEGAAADASTPAPEATAEPAAKPAPAAASEGSGSAMTARDRLRQRMAARKAQEAAVGAESATTPAPKAGDPADAAKAEKESIRDRLRRRKAARARGEDPDATEPKAEAPAKEGDGGAARERMAERLRGLRKRKGEGPSEAKAKATSDATRQRDEVAAGDARDGHAEAKAEAEAAAARLAGDEAEQPEVKLSARERIAQARAKKEKARLVREKEFRKKIEAKKVVLFGRPQDREQAKKKAAEAPPAAFEPPKFPRTQNPYVDDPVWDKLVAPIRRVFDTAVETDLGRPIRKVLAQTFGPERERLEELLLGFIENQGAVMRGRFLPEELEKYIWIDPRGDLVLRYGDGDVKVIARCWEYFFLFRDRRELPRDRVEAIQQLMGSSLTFAFADTGVSKMSLDETLNFDPVHGAHFIRASLELGGWCEMRFEAGSAFTDGRVLVIKLQPRVVRGKDVPTKAKVSPRMFAQMLRDMRGR
jgi:hypothetical protein